MRASSEHQVTIPSGYHQLPGSLVLPAGAQGIVVFAHGSGSGRFSPRNQYVARVLQDAGLATLLLDLLEESEAEDREKIFDVELLAERLQSAVDWLRQQSATQTLRLGYFGASTGAGAALMAAARYPEVVAAVVSRGGRPDLAGDYLSQVRAPTLLIVGGNDDVVIELNQQAVEQLRCPTEMVIVPGATHLFEEPGTLEEVARLAREWFVRHLESSGSGVRQRFTSREDHPVTVFRDREDGARRLAAKFRHRQLCAPVVLAIPRGGVVTGAVLASELGADLDVALSRKLRAPGQPELAIGAIGEDGQVYLNPDVEAYLGDLEDYLEGERRHQLAEIARRRKLFRRVRPPAPLAGRSVIVTDDGIATGSTMIAALHAIRAQGPRELIVAVPVASPERLVEIRRHCDDVVCLLAPERFSAVGQFYRDFTPVEDEEAIAILRRHVASFKETALHGR